MGPGKADLLEAIQATGSISAAGPQAGHELPAGLAAGGRDEPRASATPLVDARLGGAGGGGARVTDLGQEALRRYRALQDQAWDAVRAPPPGIPGSWPLRGRPDRSRRCLPPL